MEPRSVFKDFARDIADDAVGKWSGIGGILFVILAAAFPFLLLSVRPFLWLGVICFFVSCIRAWAVEHGKLVPTVEVLPDHPYRFAEVCDKDGRLLTEYHRVVVQNNGVTPITDAHLEIERFINEHQSVDVKVMGIDDTLVVDLPHVLPRAFEVMLYVAADDTLHFVGRREHPHLWIKRPSEPFRIYFAIRGTLMQTQRYSLSVIPQEGHISLSNPEPSDALALSLHTISRDVSSPPGLPAKIEVKRVEPVGVDVDSLHEANTRLQNTIAAQQDTIALLERNTRELQPRRLDEKDRSIVLAALAPATKFWTDSAKTPRVMVVAMNCSDCTVYARDFEAIFTEAGFTITDPTAAYYPSYESDPDRLDDVRSGITIRYDPQFFEKVIPEAKYVDALIAGLTQAGITFRVLEREMSSFTFIIGER